MKLEEFKKGLVLRIFKGDRDLSGDLVLVTEINGLDITLERLEKTRGVIITTIEETCEPEDYRITGFWRFAIIDEKDALEYIESHIRETQDSLEQNEREHTNLQKSLRFYKKAERTVSSANSKIGT